MKESIVYYTKIETVMRLAQVTTRLDGTVGQLNRWLLIEFLQNKHCYWLSLNVTSRQHTT